MDKFTFSKRNLVHVCASTFKMLFIRTNYVKNPENSIDSLILLVVLGTPSCAALNEFLIHM